MEKKEYEIKSALDSSIKSASANKRLNAKSSRELPQRVAILATHGMGKQVPFETIEDIVATIKQGLELKESGAGEKVVCLSNSESTDTGILSYASLSGSLFSSERIVDVYEAYWSPIPEGKISAGRTLWFLLSAGVRGIVQSRNAKFQRWIFEKWVTYEINPLKLLVQFLMACMLFTSVFAVMLAAVFLPTVKFMAPFTGGHVSKALVTDVTLVLVVLFGACLVAALPYLPFFANWKVDTTQRSFLLPACKLGAILGGITLVLGAVAIIVHLIFDREPNATSLWLKVFGMGIHQSDIVTGRWYPAFVISIWLPAAVFGYVARELIVQFVGDVAIYLSCYDVSEFLYVRDEIREQVYRTFRHVYRKEMSEEANDSSENRSTSRPYYDHIIVLGHSLGSVISYDVLNRLIVEDEKELKDSNVTSRTKLFMTYGSPLNKTAFVFRNLKANTFQVREALAAESQPLIRHRKYRPQKWINIYSPHDIVSGPLEFYEDGSGTNPIVDIVDPKADVPLLAHVMYSKNQVLQENLIAALL